MRDGGLPVVAHRAANEGIGKGEGNPPSSDNDSEDLHREAKGRGDEYAVKEVDGGELSGCEGGGLEEGEGEVSLVFEVSLREINSGLERSSAMMKGQGRRI